MSEIRGSTLHRTARAPGKVERVLASVALFVLRLMRPKVPIDHVRLEWFCTCGVQLYADYPDSGDIAEFEESLGYAQEKQPSFTQLLGEGPHTKMLRELVSSPITHLNLIWILTVISILNSGPRLRHSDHWYLRVLVLVLCWGSMLLAVLALGQFPASFCRFYYVRRSYSLIHSQWAFPCRSNTQSPT
jgi:hypothetical protein